MILGRETPGGTLNVPTDNLSAQVMLLQGLRARTIDAPTRTNVGRRRVVSAVSSPSRIRTLTEAPRIFR